MKCVVGIDLGSTTTKAVLLDESGGILGRGITNSRSSYETAAAVAREEAHRAARFHLFEQALSGIDADDASRHLLTELDEAFRRELHRDQLAALRREIGWILAEPAMATWRDVLAPAVEAVLDRVDATADELFGVGAERRSDFFRDLAGADFVTAAEAVAEAGGPPFERLLALYDRAILAVETNFRPRPFGEVIERALACLDGAVTASLAPLVGPRIRRAAAEPLVESAFAGTGYGRQTLPFPRESVRSEILCHGRGAHRFFPQTRTVLDIGGQDTKAIQVDPHGVVTGFQMNDRCAAGCGRYLGYIADELNLGLHELGPLALGATKQVKVNSTCTVFAGAELRERLALGERREDVLAGLHRSMMLRAMSLLARSGGVHDQLSFTGGVCKNPMATKVLRELVSENYGASITINVHADSIYMGALGAALFALDDLRAGRGGLLPAFAAEEAAAGMEAMR